MMRLSLVVIVILAIGLMTVWACLALFYKFPAPEALRNITAILFGLVGITAVSSLIGRFRWLPILIFLVAFGSVVIWWASIKPPREGDWAHDVARQVTGSIDGDRLTLKNVRNFGWNPDGSAVERWETRSYDLRKLQTLDLIMSYWAGPEMAHMILSFGFEDGAYLAWSIEVRRHSGGAFSPLADLFKANPLVIVAADERDVVRVRSNIRDEDVRLFRMRTPPENATKLLLQYVADANALAEHPEFYNSLTTNCTTASTRMMRAVGAKFPFDWRLIVNGYLPDFAYQRGALDSRIPFSELKAAAHIDARARAADTSVDFSKLIRAGIPSPLIK